MRPPALIWRTAEDSNVNLKTLTPIVPLHLSTKTWWQRVLERGEMNNASVYVLVRVCVCVCTSVYVLVHVYVWISVYLLVDVYMCMWISIC